MRTVFEKYPELLLVDATYKLSDLRMPVYILHAVNRNGLSQMVAVFLVTEETTSIMRSAVALFQEHNPALQSTVSIMTDKDFVERGVLRDLMPNAHLLICLYHTLRTFRHEIHCEKMSLKSAERDVCQQLISMMNISQG